MIVTQPYDGEGIAEVHVHTARDIETKLQHAVQAFTARSNWLPAFRRIEILRRLARLVEKDGDVLALLIAREGGKPLADAKVEVARAINGIESAAAHIEHLAGTEIPMGLTPSSADRWAFTIKEPIGPVVAISAFNHPLNLIVHQVVPAIATGCPVLIKPAPATPLTCLHFIGLVHEAGLPEPWCQAVILDDNALAQTLATDPRIAFFSFIGSSKVGWHLRSQLAPGVRFALEHGGAAPVLIDKSADIETLIEPLVKGGYYHAGQVCVSVQRIYVHEDLENAFVNRFSERVRQLTVGDPQRIDTEVGPLIAPREVDRVERWVSDAIVKGAILTAGGERLGERSFRPTVLVDPSCCSQVSTEEIFGPVTCIYGYKDLLDAIERANECRFAFQAAVFSREIESAMRAAKLLDASAVMINDHSAFRTDWMPFAGRRQSGFGVGGIPHTMNDMLQDKMIVLRHSL